MIKAKLFVLGTQRELLSTDLEYYRTRGATTGRPGPIPMGGLVTLAFTSGEGDDRLLYALLHSPEGELCTLTTAKIVFYAGDPDGVVLFEYRLKDAAFIYWKEEFNAAGEAPMTVTLTFSAAIQEIKGITWVKLWRESEVLSEEGVVREKEKQEVASGDRKKKGDVLGEIVLKTKEVNNVKLTHSGITKVRQHLSRMDPDVANDVMVGRLNKIANGEMKATTTDLNFYTHELREMELMSTGLSYEKAHIQALEDYGIKYKRGFEKNLYTPEALKAGDEALIN